MYISKDKKINILQLLIYTLKIIKNKKKRIKRKRKRFWCQDWLVRRYNGKDFNGLVDNELRLEDPESFRDFTRMSRELFDKLLAMVGPLIAKQNTVLREAISSTTRLLITLRYLATGNSFMDLSYRFKVSRHAISSIISETLDAIYRKLSIRYMKCCECASDWESVANDFNRLWNFPMCLGAIDGKHIEIKVLNNDGPSYYNYKGFNSIILLAVVDANYKFIMVDVGTKGSANDTAAFDISSIGNAIKNNTLDFPDDDFLPGTNSKVPFVFISDGDFGLSSRLLKSFNDNRSEENKLFNYRLSRARRVVENAFAIMSNRFKIFQKKINLSPEKVEILTLASCVLHNFLIIENDDITPYMEAPPVIATLEKSTRNKHLKESEDIRKKFSSYFKNIDVLPSQNEAIQNSNF